MQALQRPQDQSVREAENSANSGTFVEPPNQSTREMAVLSEGLATLPNYVFELNGLLSSVPVDLKRVGEVIRAVPSLAAQVIWLCNSALFNLRERATSIEQAVILLGTERLRTLVLTCSLVDYVSHHLSPSELHAFWQHSFLTAILSERIASWTSYPRPEQAYLAGLLHDVGILPLLTLAAREPRSSAVPGPGGWGESVAMEQNLFGTDHCAIGRWIGINWNFSAVVIDVFAHHHQPQEARHDPHLVGIVAAADRICQKRAVRLGAEPPPTDSANQNRYDDLLRDCLPLLSAEERMKLAEVLETDYLHMIQLLELTFSGAFGTAVWTRSS